MQSSGGSSGCIEMKRRRKIKSEQRNAYRERKTIWQKENVKMGMQKSVRRVQSSERYMDTCST